MKWDFQIMFEAKSMHLSTQQNCHVRKRGAVVLEKLIPESDLLCIVMNEVPTGKHQQSKQLVPVTRGSFPTGENGQKTIKAI